jgi:hypothetical protein
MVVSVQTLDGLDNITGIANAQIGLATNYASAIAQGVADLSPPQINAVFPTGGVAPTPSTTTPPEFFPVIWNTPAVPSGFTGELDIGDYLPEAFDEEAPVLAFGTAPAVISDTVPEAPAVTLTFEDPTLELSMPAPPDLLLLNVTQFDGLNLPTIDYTVPELTVVAPSVVAYTPGTEYTSSLLSTLKTSLEDRITNGGTGLNPDVENAIWDRGREREARAMSDAILSLEQMESLGYALPGGVYLDARLKIATENANANMGLSREIMIKQAELELTNVLKALDTASALEAKMIEYANQTEQRLFDAARYATEAGVAVYNARVQAYAAYVDAYKAKVQVYTAQVQAETAKVDAYRATIAAEEAKAQINVALVQQYKVQADVALSAVEVYKARIAAIQSKAEIEQLKVAIFGEQIKGYTAKVNAYTANVEGFRASIQAEGTKQEAFRSQVDAYKAQVEAGAKVADARIAEYRGRIEAKSVEWDGYKAIAAAEASRAQSINAVNQTVAETYKAEVAGNSAYNDAILKQWQAKLEQAQRIAEIGVAVAKANGELYISARALALDASKVAAQVSAQIGAAALNAVNWSQSFSINGSVSEGFQSSFARSESKSESENYNYNFSA